MNSKMRSSVMGLLLSQFSSPLPMAQKEPVAYLYNGVELPDINKGWMDKNTHPYAFIRSYTRSSGETSYNLVLTAEAPTTRPNGDYLYFGTNSGLAISYSLTSDLDGWEPASNYSIGCSYSTKRQSLVWTSHNVLNEDGSVYLAASEPVPVGGTAVDQKPTVDQYPTLAAQNTWYKSAAYRSNYTEINIVKEYTVTGNETASWAADVYGTGSIMCYRNGSILTICSMGAEKIMANKDSKYLFADAENAPLGFVYVTAINGLDMLDTSNVTDMGYMFNWAQSVINLDVSHFDTSKVTNMGHMFYDCYALETLDVSHFDTSKVTDMRGMFSSCWALKALDVSGFDTSNVTNMNSLFNACKLVPNIDVSNFDTSKVTDMAYMFANLDTVTSLDLSNFDTSKVTDMYAMFFQSKALTSLDLSSFDTSKVTNMDSMFWYCDSLESLDLRSWDTSAVTNMEWLFADCPKLKAIYVGSGWTTANVTNTDHMFEDCGVSSVTYV